MEFSYKLTDKTIRVNNRSILYFDEILYKPYIKSRKEKNGRYYLNNLEQIQLKEFGRWCLKEGCDFGVAFNNWLYSYS